MNKLFKYIFNKFFLAYYLSQQNKPVTHKDLDYAFTDVNGKRYYQFTMNQAIPMNRLNKLRSYMTLMELKMSAENMDLIIDKAVGLIEAGLKEKSNAARCAALLLEIKDRKDRIVPADLVYNYLGVLYIREDEDPMEIDNAIHTDKINMFLHECARKDSFFFHLKELKKLSDSLVLSPSEWAIYLEQSHLEGKQMIEKIRVYTSEPL